MKAYTIIFFIIIFQTGNIFSQNPGVSVRLDTNEILIGDQVNMHIKFSCPDNYDVLWPDIKDTIIENLEVLKRTSIDTIYSKSNILFKQKLNLTTFDSGYYQLPQLKFKYKLKDDTSQNFVLSEPLFLKVNTISVDTTQSIKPIKAPLKAPYTFKEIFPWVLGGLGVIATIIFFIYYLKKRKKNEAVFRIKPKPRIPAHVIALDKLDKLRRKKLWQTGNIKSFYTELTGIIREYLFGRFGINAMEMTSFEIDTALKNINQIPKDYKEQLNKTLVIADLVKFAKENPLPEENESSMNFSENFIRKTIPVTAEKKAENKIDKSKILEN